LDTVLDERIKHAVERYGTSLIRLAFTYVKSVPDAEDVVQDVFVSYMQKAPKFESAGQEKAWLLRVTANKCRDRLKSAWRKKRAEMPEELRSMPEELAYVLHAVMQLEDRYRLPVYLYYFEDMPIRDIALSLKANASTVGTWLERGRKALKGILGEDYYG
jgi:RNA polymerase sigma-70 factor (ECF subfamily)